MNMKNIKVLEEKYARLELMLEELDTVIIRQDKEISVLRKKIELLMVREAERELDDNNSILVADVKPPHW
ncbi:MAG: SlyX protein [Rhodobacteraceae bacterium]|jgi:SlyX protein|nr:SlyX protein [Paracoccaceae bacterium]|tara:strand:- start:234 stop:443 length:210 start_codon:yes stop_codon:yes gene_type:complete